MNWKWCVRNSLLPNIKFYASICLEGLRKTTVNPQSGQPVARSRFNSRIAEYKAEMPST
jgi:hypothetical protein